MLLSGLWGQGSAVLVVLRALWVWVAECVAASVVLAAFSVLYSVQSYHTSSAAAVTDGAVPVTDSAQPNLFDVAGVNGSVGSA